MIPTSAFIAVLTIIFAPLLSFLIARRQFSGKVASSEASELWAESKAIREYAVLRAEACEKENDRLEAELQVAKVELMQARERIAKLETRISVLEGHDDPPAHLA